MGNIQKVSKPKIDQLLNDYKVYNNLYDAQNQTNAINNVAPQWWGDDGRELEVDFETGLVTETQENGEKVRMGYLDKEAIKQIQRENDAASRLNNRELDKMLQDDKNAGSYDKGPKKEESKGEILRSNSVQQNKTDIEMDFSDFKYKVPEHSTGSPSEGNYGKYDTETVIGNSINSQLSDEQKQANATERFGTSYVFDGSTSNNTTQSSSHVGLGSLGEPIKNSDSSRVGLGNLGEPITTNNSTRVGLGSLGEPISNSSSSTASTISGVNNSSSSHVRLGSLGESIGSQSTSTTNHVGLGSLGESSTQSTSNISGINTQYGKFDTTTPIGQAMNSTQNSNPTFDVNRDFNINNK